MVKINKKTVPFSTKLAFKKNIDFYLDNGEVIELSFSPSIDGNTLWDNVAGKRIQKCPHRLKKPARTLNP